jgi:hypothetical protein
MHMASHRRSLGKGPLAPGLGHVHPWDHACRPTPGGLRKGSLQLKHTALAAHEVSQLALHKQIAGIDLPHTPN